MRYLMSIVHFFLSVAFLVPPFSQIQAINKERRDPRDVERDIVAGRVHLDCCCMLYRKQMACGAHFLHEHPQGATSWSEPCIQAVLQLQGVRRVRGDQCQFGQVSDTGNPIRKATGFMSNSECVLDILNKRCFGRHGFCSRELGGKHQDCIGRTAKRLQFIATRCARPYLLVRRRNFEQIDA